MCDSKTPGVAITRGDRSSDATIVRVARVRRRTTETSGRTTETAAHASTQRLAVPGRKRWCRCAALTLAMSESSARQPLQTKWCVAVLVSEAAKTACWTCSVRRRPCAPRAVDLGRTVSDEGDFIFTKYTPTSLVSNPAAALRSCCRCYPQARREGT
jgi:hypothetical protein